MVQVPRDIGQAELDEAAFNYRPVKGYRSSGDPADVADAVKALLAARNPLIYAGQGVLWAEASEELVQFAELVNVPVMTTNTGKSAFPENHPSVGGSRRGNDDPDGAPLLGPSRLGVRNRLQLHHQPGVGGHTAGQDTGTVHRR